MLAGFLPEGPQPSSHLGTWSPISRSGRSAGRSCGRSSCYCLDKEIPHGTAVEVTKFSERENGMIDLDATIYCEKDTHKGIIIGKQGAMLKKISTMARADMERFLGTKVYLETWVKVKERWRDNLNLIRSFGFDERD